MFWAARGLHWRLQRAYQLAREGLLANLWNRRRARDRPLQFWVVQRGMPCKCGSSTRVEYVPALCTHRPSLLPMNVPMKFSEGACDPARAGEREARSHLNLNISRKEKS